MWAVPQEGQSAMGFEKVQRESWSLSSLIQRTFQTHRVWVCPYPFPPWDHLYWLHEAPNFVLRCPIWSIPALIAQSPFLLWVLGSSLLLVRTCVSRLRNLHWVSPHGSSQELHSRGWYLLGMAQCPRCHTTSLTLFCLGVAGMGHFVDKIAFELGLEGCTEFC